MGRKLGTCLAMAIGCGFGLLLGAPTVQAQEPAPTPEFRLLAGASHQFDTDIDDGGEFSVTRADAGIAATFEFNPDLRLDADFGYEFSHYDF